MNACAALALVLEPLACAHQTDEQTRAAFESVRTPSGGTGRRRARTGRRNPSTGARSSDPWQRVHDVLTASIGLFGVGHDDASVGELAGRLCAVAPEARATDAGSTYVCFPEPPVEVAGHAFTLELAPSGVIGLQAADLSGDASRSLVEQARQATARHCATPFQALQREPDDEHAADFQICPVDGGSTLAVGRTPAGRDRWLVQLTVLASS